MTVLDEVDRLYELAVTEPSSVNDQAILDWTEGVAAGSEIDRHSAKYVRRCVNAARKLAAFWSAREPARSHPLEWPSRVDLALGVRAWRPQLELAQYLLEAAPGIETYEKVAELFRMVNNEPFLDGVSYEVWTETRQN